MGYHTYGNYINTENTWLTKIPSHWKLTTFNRMLKGIKDGTHGTHSRVLDGCPLLSAKNVHDRYLDISDTESTISEEEHKSIVSNGYPAKNDVLVTCVGTIGRSYVYDRDEPLSFQRSVAFLRLEEAVIPQYCKYFIESKGYQDYLLSVAKISAQSGVYMGDISKSPILDVPFEEQQKIAAFLDYKTQQIDQLIAKKKALIEKLEEKRIAVITQAVTKGLDKNVTLKPSGVDCLGDVPEHWGVCRLKFIASIENGRDYKDVEVEDGGFPVYGSGGEFRRASAYLYEGESVLFGRKGTIDKPLYVNSCFWTVDTMFYSDILSNTIPMFLYYSALTFQYQKLATQTALPSITQNDLENNLLCYPELNEQDQIVSYLDVECRKIDEMLEVNNKTIDTLEEYRSALITSAVTGKIDVRNVLIPKEAA